MPYHSKVEQYGLQKYVEELRKQGMGIEAIAKKINENYGESIMKSRGLKSTNVISPMSISRYLDKCKRDDALVEIEEGGVPEERIYEEFKEKMRDIDDKLRQNIGGYQDMLNTAIKESDLDTIKVVGSRLQNDLEQIRKAWVSLQQWGNMELRPVAQAREVNMTQINNLIIDFSNVLCPKCRAKVRDVVTNYTVR